MNSTHKYDDIIFFSRPVSQKHPPMSMMDRAAQFSPFSALTGFDEAIDKASQAEDALSPERSAENSVFCPFETDEVDLI